MTTATANETALFDRELDEREPIAARRSPRRRSDDEFDRYYAQAHAERSERRSAERARTRRRQIANAIAVGIAIAAASALVALLIVHETNVTAASDSSPAATQPAAPASGSAGAVPEQQLSPATPPNGTSTTPETPLTPSTPANGNSTSNGTIPSGNNTGNMGTGGGPTTAS